METFKNEYEYLVHLIACAMQGKQPAEKPEALSFEKVFDYGKEHEVANIAFISVQKLHTKPNDALYTKWKTAYAFSIQRHANQMNARRVIVDALDEAGIRHAEVQGTVMKTLYPYPEWRMMSDIDFIIDKQNLEKAQSVMNALGYRTENPNGCEIDAYGKNGIAVELHSDFFTPQSICYGTITDVFSFSTRTDNPYSYQPSSTIFYLYNLLHCVKHFLDHGSGIRRILDLYIMQIRLSGEVDHAYINRIIADCGYQRTVEELFAVMDKWFHNKSSKTDLSELEKRIYLSNNHGTTQVRLMNEHQRSDKRKQHFFKMRKYISLIFPSKENIYRKYPVCRHKAYPLALCWVYRWFHVLKNPQKRRAGSKLLSEINKAKIK